MMLGIDALMEQLNRDLLEMGMLVENAIDSASMAMREYDLAHAQKAVELGVEARQKERSIEDLCLRLLLRYQPVASDLRIVSAALKMITDMERVSDQAGDIARIVAQMESRAMIKSITHLPRMAGEAITMVHTSIDAFVKRDVELARTVKKMDDIVDGLFIDVVDELTELIRSDGDIGHQAIDLLMIAKYLERIGDHAQNIAEWAEYSVTGVHEREKLVDILR